jgi:uncharacterized LabA/DUF88 family protein
VGKNVAVFVDVANIFYAAKAAGVDIDYVTLLKSAIAGRDFVRAYAYTGLDPDNENQRNFHNFLSRHDYRVVSKDIRKYGDGKVKANLDIELVVDMMKTARNLDVAIVVSGDGDFAPAIRAVQEMGVRVEVVSFRGNTSSDLIDVADQFTDIVQMAKVEKGSSRSGRRVADDGEDLSMTEVPDKLTEGTGRGRGRGVGRGRGRAGETEREPVAARGRSSVRGGVRTRRVEAEPEVPASAGAPIGGLVALPGEKLSKAALARLEATVPAVPADEAETDAPAASPAIADDGTDLEAEGQRRRRRRGGRGRGRGRGRGEGGELGELGGVPIVVDGSIEDAAEEVDEGPAELVASAPRGPRPGAFGSVWDSQIGQSRPPAPSDATRFDVDDDDEPAIPEYLIAEQRRGGSSNRAGGRSAGGNRGGRGGAYQVAMDRERYGRGGGGGINRYPDVSGRTAGGGTAGTIGRGGRDSRRDDRPPVVSRPERERPAVGRSDEPWSEVPPELEALLRAQIATRGGDRPGGAPKVDATGRDAPTAAAEMPTEAPTEAPAKAPARKPRASTRARAAAPGASAATSDAAEAAPEANAPKPKRASTRTKAASTATAAGAAEDGSKPRASTRTRAASTAKAKPKAAATDETGAAAVPKRRAAARKPAASSET